MRSSTETQRLRMALLIGAGALLVGTLSGCSQDDGLTRIVFAAGQDPSGATAALIEEYNAAHPDVEVTFQVMPANTDTQHDAYTTYLSARETSIDVYSLDVIWTAEFARANWIVPLPDGLIDPDAFLSGPMESVTWEGTRYAVPWFTDAGLLYYRIDLLADAGLDVPVTWDEFTAACAAATPDEGMGFVWQGARYEGLICNFLEFLWGRGGSLDRDHLVSSPDRAASEIAGTIDFMRSLTETGVSPASVLTYKEEDSRRIYTEGQALFLRNWPYVWSFAEGEESKVAGTVGIAPLPHAAGETSYSTIGGWNIALSAYSEHPDEALEFISFITGTHSLKKRAIEGGYLPTRIATYADEDVLTANPYYASFFEVFKNTKSRPRSPHYPQLSDVVQDKVHRALSGEIDSETAARDIVSELTELYAR